MGSFEMVYGYPPGDNVLLEEDSEQSVEVVHALEAAGVPDDLCEFYSEVREVRLPDVGNGFFVHSAQDVIDGISDAQQPTSVVGGLEDAITVFGSDGGGGLFALSGSADQVYLLNGGSLIGSIYDVDETGVTVIQGGLLGFMEYLRRELMNSTRSK